jgi:hypothetical protein
LLALVTGSAITALCGVIETYITDNPSVTVKIEHSNGSKILINVDNIKELEKIKPILLEAQKLAP